MVTESLKGLLAERKEMKQHNIQLRAENQKLREQRDAANAVIQELNRIIAGDTE